MPINRRMRARQRNTVMVMLVLLITLVAGCGGAKQPGAPNETPAPSAATTPGDAGAPPAPAASGSSDKEKKPESPARGEAKLNTIQLVVTESASEHLPNGVYVTQFIANQSKGSGVAFMASAAEILNSVTVQVQVGGTSLTKEGATRTLVVGYIVIRRGNPPTGFNQLVNAEPITVAIAYDEATNTFRGSFKGLFADGLQAKQLNMERKAVVEASFWVENPN